MYTQSVKHYDREVKGRPRTQAHGKLKRQWSSGTHLAQILTVETDFMSVQSLHEVESMSQVVGGVTAVRHWSDSVVGEVE